MWRYIVFFVLFILWAGAAFGLAYIGVLARTGTNCNHANHTPDTFMVSCHPELLADYEHGGLYYGLEKTAIKSLKAADIVILGNSRIQFAMATPYADQFFADRGVRYFQLGFGYTQVMDFPLDILKKQRVVPKMLVINADPYFAHERRGPAKKIEEFPWRSYVEYKAKQLAWRASHYFCYRWPSYCPLKLFTANRSKTTGRWIFDVPLDPKSEVKYNARPFTEKHIAKTVAAAKDFFAAVPVPPECVVLTNVPSPDFNPAYLNAVGKALNMQVIQVRVPNMMTIDGYHLDAKTAERWEKAFLPKLEPIMQRCVK